jgi:hypothetical protein
MNDLQDRPPGPDCDAPRRDEAPQAENRDFANIVALIFIAALAIGGYWLLQAIQKHNDMLNCVASGRRDCVDLGHPDATAR